MSRFRDFLFDQFGWSRGPKSPTEYLSGERTYNIDRHKKHIRKLYAEYPFAKQKQKDWLANFTVEEIAKTFPEHVKYFDERLRHAIYLLFIDNGIFKSEEPTLFESRKHLTELQAELTNNDLPDKVQSGIVVIFLTIFGQMPVPTQSNLKVPLHSTIKHFKDVLGFIMLETRDTLPGTSEIMRKNTFRISSIPEDKPSSRQHIFPPDYDGDVTEYLHGTALDNFLEGEVGFSIPRATFAEHGAVFAKSGHGKTQTLRALIANFIQDPDPPALFIIDSLGSLIEGIEDLDVFNTTLKDRLVILDPSRDQYMPSLNFFQLQSDDLCFYLFKAIDQSFTQRQATMIAYLMEYMRHVPNASLMTLIQVCNAKEDPHPGVLDQLSPFAQAFFAGEFFAKKPDNLIQQTKGQIAQRLFTLGRLPKFEQMFSGTTGIPFDPFQCMQEKKIVLINTDARPPRLGGLGEASGIFGRFILAQCLDAARGRPKHDRDVALLVVDEAKAYMDDQAALILSDARQFGLGMMLATQFPHQLPEGVRREINTNTSIRLLGPVEHAVAAQYSRDMFTTPEFIMGMKSYARSHAEWAAYVSNMTDKAVRLNVPFGVLEKMPKRKAPAPLTTEEAMLKDLADTMLPVLIAGLKKEHPDLAKEIDAIESPQPEPKTSTGEKDHSALVEKWKPPAK